MNKSFVKYSALGNDYIVIDPNISNIQINSENIISICDRNNGPGSDGILYGPNSSTDLSLRIFNPDGSECEKSGNGIRIFSNYLYDNNYVDNNTFDISLPNEKVTVTPVDSSKGLFKVRMGKVKPGHLSNLEYCYPFIGKEVSFNDFKFTGSFIDIGNPHMVLETTSPSKELANNLGPVISNHKMFLNRANVQFCKVISRNEIRIEIFERGAGYTLASGSSSCAAAAALYLQNKVDNKVKVLMPGGELSIEIDNEDFVHLLGTSKLIYSGEMK